MQDEHPNSSFKRGGELSYFARRVWIATLIIAAVGGGILLLWLAARVFLLFFAAVLFGIFLRASANAVGRVTRLPRDWSLGLAIVLLLLVLGGTGWLLAAPISKQVAQLSEELPQAAQKMEARLRRYSWGEELVNKIQNPSGLSSQAASLMKKVQAFFSVSLEGIIDVLVILFCGFYLAARPELYVNGFLRLVPRGRRDRGRQVLLEIGDELRRWLFGQIVSMAIIGLLTWLGLFLLGISASEVLGVLAGFLDFVPVVGPWIAGVISCIIALLKSPMHAVYVACLFLGLHLLEGHIVIPLVQKQATRLPPVLTILAMVLFYMLFGFLGLVLAVPLLALVTITIRTLYVEDVIDR